MLIADIKNDGILGLDFLTSHNCQLDMMTKNLNINGEIVPCRHTNNTSVFTSCRIEIKQNVLVPPETEMIIIGKPIGKVIGIVEPVVKRKVF